MWSVLHERDNMLLYQGKVNKRVYTTLVKFCLFILKIWSKKQNSDVNQGP